MTYWQPASTYSIDSIPNEIKTWLLAPGSMTALLRAEKGDNVRIALRFQEWQTPAPEEQQALDVVLDMPAMIREVDIYCETTPVMFGRTVLPEITLQANTTLQTLGTQPLGDFLFKNPDLRRSEFEIAYVGADTFAHQRACASQVCHDEKVWARRSTFYLGDYPLLLTEAFYASLFVDSVC